MQQRRRAPSIAALSVVVAIAIGIAVAVSVGRPGQSPAASLIPSATSALTATSTPTPTSTVTPTVAVTAAATATSGTGTISGPCDNMTFQAGDVPIVAPRRSGQYLQIALDAVRPAADGGNRWFVRFFLPRSAPTNAIVALDATVAGPQGPLLVRDYEAGPPNSETVPVTQPITVQPCAFGASPGPGGAGVPARSYILIGAHTGPVSSGTYTLTWRGIRLPEGTTATEAWTVTLTCTIDAGPNPQRATSCR
jgi:hypothetical protein